MRKKLLILLVILIVIVGAIALLVFNLEGLVNRNKDFLLSRAETALGRSVSVDEIGVTLRGGIGVRLANLAIADDPAFSNEPFVVAKDLQVNVKLMPLLKKQLEIKRITVHEPVIHVIRNEDGILNVNSLGRGGEPAPLTGGSSPASPAGGGAAAGALAISLFNIEGGELYYTDKARDLDLAVTHIESKATDLSLDSPVSLDFKAAVITAEQNVRLQGTFGPIPDPDSIVSVPVDARLEVGPIELSQILAAFPEMQTAVPPNVQIDGPVKLSVEAAGLWPDLPLKLEVDASQTTIRAAGNFTKPAGVPLTLGVTVVANEDSIAAQNIELVLHEARAGGRGTIRLTPEPTYDFIVQSQPVSLAGWERLVPTVKPYGLDGELRLNARVTGAASGTPSIKGTATVRNARMTLPQLPKPISQMQAEASFTATSAEVSKASFHIGSSRFETTASIRDFTSGRVDYRVASPALALTDVRPPNPRAKKPEVLNKLVVQGRMSGRETPINRGDLTSATGSLANLDYQKLKAKFVIQGQELQLPSFSVQTLDGQLSGSGTIIMHETAPVFDITTKARNVNLVKLFDQLPAFTRPYLRGRANLDLTISGQGAEWNDLRKTLSGDGLAELFDGAVLDVNVFKNITDRLGGFPGASNLVSQRVKDKYPGIFKSTETSFKDLKSTFVIEQGALKARNVRVRADDYSMLAQGAVGLDGALNLTATLSLSKLLSSDVIRDVDMAKYIANDQGQIEIPFALTGTLPKVSTKLDDSFIQNALQRALADQGQNLLEKGIRNLFGKQKKSGAPRDSL